MERSELPEDTLVADGFDDAILGYSAYSPGREQLVIYDYWKCIEILKTEGMTEEEAIEYLEFNTIGAWVGEKTPVFVYTE